MLYADWVEVVLRAIIAKPDHKMYDLRAVGLAVGLDMGSGIPGERDDLILALDAAADDLDLNGFLTPDHPSYLEVRPPARKYRTISLRDRWPILRQGFLEPDDELYLRQLNALSEVQHDDWAEARHVPPADVFEALNWEWDTGRALAIHGALASLGFVRQQGVNGDRVTIGGTVRVHDEVNATLAEARDHLSSQWARAAGCIAGVALERRLKELAHSRPDVALGKIPTLADYNAALWGDHAYSKVIWREIQVATDLRNLCAHALDQEPNLDDARRLIDLVERLLRAL